MFNAKARSSGSGGRGIASRMAITGVGDSIMAFQDAATANVFGPSLNSIMGWAFSSLTGLAYNITANRGVGSKTIDLVITEQLQAALADDSDILWIHAGINNINPGIDATTPTVAEVIDRMRRLVSLASAKRLIILDALTPLASGSISGAYPRRADIPLINAGYKLLAAEFKNVMYNDVYTPLVGSDGFAMPGFTVSDGIHLTALGARAAGLYTAQNLLTTGNVQLYPAHRVSGAVLLPAMTGSGGTTTPGTGTINGTVAASCNVQIATNQTGVVVTASVETGRRNSMRLRIQNGNALASAVRLQLADNTANIASFTSGQLIRGSGRIKVVANDGSLQRHDFAANWSEPTVKNAVGMYLSGIETTPIFPAAPYELRMWTPAITLAANSQTVGPIFTITIGPGGDVTVDLMDWTLERVVAA